MTTQHGLAVAIFALTYALIATRRLRLLPIGRPAGALLGATLIVVTGVMTPQEAYHAIDGDTIVLLFAMMVVSAELAQAGVLDWLAKSLVALCPTPRALLVGVIATSALTSAFLVNDTICLLMTPVIVATCVRAGLPLAPYLLALATSANLGSALTLVGNPQNMVIGSMSGLDFGVFFVRMLPAVGLALAVHVAFSLAFFRRVLPAVWPVVPDIARRFPREGAWHALTLLGVMAAFFAGAHLGFAALAGAVFLMLLRRDEPTETFRRVDWTILVFFCGLFIVTEGLAATGLVAEVWSDLQPHLRLDDGAGVAGFTAAMTLGSNLVSNVPMVLLTGPHIPSLGAGDGGWLLLAFVTTVAGNLTLVGSVANIIVAEAARDHHTLGFMEYLRFGAAATLLSLASGVPVLMAVG
jgi:Na+/H+ antiporter NhaD/arsenite permease-like protein